MTGKNWDTDLRGIKHRMIKSVNMTKIDGILSILTVIHAQMDEAHHIHITLGF